MRVTVLLLPSGLLLLAARLVLQVQAHFAGQETTVRVARSLHLHLSIVCLLLHGLVAPVYSELSYPRFISKNCPSGMSHQLGSTGSRPLFLWYIFSQHVMDVIANSNELLATIANGNYQSCDT